MPTATAERRGRFAGRAQVFTRSMLSRPAAGRRSVPVDPVRILIAHHLLLGDADAHAAHCKAARSGDRRTFRRIYRRLKMHNCPELKPYLYGGKR